MFSKGKADGLAEGDEGAIQRSVARVGARRSAGAALAMNGQRHFQILGNLPDGRIVRMVPHLLRDSRGQKYGHCAKFRNGTAGLVQHQLRVLTGDNGGKLDSSRIAAAKVVGPVIVGAAQGSGEVRLLVGWSSSAVGRQADLNVPALRVHIYQTTLQAPAIPEGVAEFVIHHRE